MSAECKRLSPDHVGPSCGCHDGACALERFDPAEYLRRFDRLAEDHVRKTLGWEFDMLEIDQRAVAALPGTAATKDTQ